MSSVRNQVVVIDRISIFFFVLKLLSVVHLGEDGPNQVRGCWSYVGNTHVGKQFLSLSAGCTNTKTVQVEISDHSVKTQET